MKPNLFVLLFIICFNVSFSQSNVAGSDFKKHFFATSLWSVANFFPDPADFYELNYGFRFSKKEAIILNATTWKYWEPLGIPLTSEKKYKHIEDYPGYVRSYGVGIVYQMFIWKQVFSSIHANTFFQKFYETQMKKSQGGFQLYFQARVGYSFDALNKRLFLEPSLSFNYWPINTNFPDSFSDIENRWPNYLLFEPHLNIGLNF
jgi:hypothetical protein